MGNKTKTKLATMAEVRRAAISTYGTIPDEETADFLSFSERDSAGDASKLQKTGKAHRHVAGSGAHTAGGV